MQDQEPRLVAERKQLERLIELMPVGEPRAECETRLANLDSASAVAVEPRFVALRGQRDATLTDWNRLFDQMEAVDQNTPEFDALFAEWEKVDEEYKRLDELYYQRLEEHQLTKDSTSTMNGSQQ